MTILLQFCAAFLLLAMTALAQGLWYGRMIRRLPQWGRAVITLLPGVGRGVVMAIVCVMAVLPHMLAIILWALFYAFVAAGVETIPFETALYFSASAYTTTGFGDVTMTEQWRVLSTLEAVNGLLLLGWSAAFFCEIIARLYRTKEAKERAR